MTARHRRRFRRALQRAANHLPFILLLAAGVALAVVLVFAFADLGSRFASARTERLMSSL